jgi:MFS transporter, DHA2 family, lincomycin resistance protein
VLLVPGTVLLTASLTVLAFVDARTSPVLIVVAYAILGAGLQLLFTALIPAGLGQLAPRLYSHGSAVLGTIEQVGAAAGTALFVSIMVTNAASASARGAAEGVATAEGASSAFMAGAFISSASILAAIFVRPPRTSPTGSSGETRTAPAPSIARHSEPRAIDEAGRRGAAFAQPSPRPLAVRDEVPSADSAVGR